MASETEHCGQKQIRRAADFCRGRIPTVCANIYTATDFCPASNSRLQRRQHKFSKGHPSSDTGCGQENILPLHQAGRKYAEGFRRCISQNCLEEPSWALAKSAPRRALCCNAF